MYRKKYTEREKTDRKMVIFVTAHRSSSGLNGNRDCRNCF